MAPGSDITGGPWEDEEEMFIYFRTIVTRQKLIYMGYGVLEDDERHSLPEPDCRPEAFDIDKNQSWQQMNRGKMSKKQRRK